MAGLLPSAGYLYGVHAGFWPDATGRFRLRVKFGSFRQLDPVAAAISSYGRALGHPQLLWCEPSANAYRDELKDLHVVLDAHRKWPGRELFDFDDMDDCLAALAEFTEGFRQRTAMEADAKPRVITDLVNTWLPQQQAAELRASRKRARDSERDAERVRAAAVAAEEQAAVDTRLSAWIAEHCTVGDDEKVEASVFNAAVHHIVGTGVKGAIERRGFMYKKVRLVPGERQVWAYMGLGLQQ